MKRALGLRYRALRVLANDLEALAASPFDGPRKFAFTWIESEAEAKQIAQAAAREKYPPRAKLMQQTLAEGGRIAAALEAGEPVSWQIYRPREQTTFRWLHLRGPDAVFVFGSYTVPAWRGNRLMTRLARFATAYYAGQDFRRLCCIVESNDKVSMRAHLYRGDRPVGWLRCLHLGQGPTVVASDARMACGVFNPSNPFVYTVRG